MAPSTGPEGNVNLPSSHTAFSSENPSFNMAEQNQHSPSAVPKPPPPPYSPEDVRTIEEMFPTVDRRAVINLLDQHNGNKDVVVNHLLQNAA